MPQERIHQPAFPAKGLSNYLFKFEAQTLNTSKILNMDLLPSQSGRSPSIEESPALASKILSSSSFSSSQSLSSILNNPHVAKSDWWWYSSSSSVALPEFVSLTSSCEVSLDPLRLLRQKKKKKSLSDFVGITVEGILKKKKKKSKVVTCDARDHCSVSHSSFD
jgi:hypothetical protein